MKPKYTWVWTFGILKVSWTLSKCHLFRHFNLVWQLPWWFVLHVTFQSLIIDIWHSTHLTLTWQCMASGVNFMQVAFQSWHEIGPCSASCSVSLLTLFRIPIPEPATTRRNNHKYEGWAFRTHRNLEQSQPNVDDTDFHIFISKIISENICRPVLCILRHSVALS